MFIESMRSSREDEDFDGFMADVDGGDCLLRNFPQSSEK